MMSAFKDFRQFILRGNVVDLAVGVIIGGAFGKIVSSLMADVVMPPIGLLIGGVDFRDLKIVLREAVEAADGAMTQSAVTLNIGIFIQTVLDFLIIGGAVYVLIKAVSALQRKVIREEEKAPEAPPPVPEATPTEKLLEEIRDLISQRGRSNP